MTATRRYWGLDRTMMEAANDQEAARAGLIEGLGATPEQLEGAKRFIKLVGHDRAPDQKSVGVQAAGVTATGYDKGEHLIIEDTHTNAAGDRVTLAYRRNGPHLEQVRIREEQVGPHTFTVTEHFGRNR